MPPSRRALANCCSTLRNSPFQNATSSSGEARPSPNVAAASLSASVMPPSRSNSFDTTCMSSVDMMRLRKSTILDKKSSIASPSGVVSLKPEISAPNTSVRITAASDSPINCVSGCIERNICKVVVVSLKIELNSSETSLSRSAYNALFASTSSGLSRCKRSIRARTSRTLGL